MFYRKLLNPKNYRLNIDFLFKRYSDNAANINFLGIQMLPDDIKKKLFGDIVVPISDKKQKELLKNLKDLDINNNTSQNIDFDKIPIPALQGANIEEHFFNISTEIIQPYVEMLERFVGRIVPRPRRWLMQAGWSKYDYTTGRCSIQFVLKL